MFGLVRPCRHGAERAGCTTDLWRAHLCGLCLGLRDEHGQLARATTNTDAVVLSVVTEAQLPASGDRRTAGPCALRGMRRAEVACAAAPGVRLAATASLLLGAATVRDKVADRDGVFGRALARRPAGRVAGRWADDARVSAAAIGLDAEPLLDAIASQAHLERTAKGRPITDFTAPAEICAGALFAQSAVLANRPANKGALHEVGRQFGRIAHLADAVEDFAEDADNGAFNPIIASGLSLPQTRHLLRESHRDLRRALKTVDLENRAAAEWLLGEEVGKAITAAFRHGDPTMGQPFGPPGGWPTAPPPVRPPGRNRGPLAAAGLALAVYCTGYACCADHTNPCTGNENEALIKSCCSNCDCGSCCDCGECCSNCNCCDCGGCDCGC